MDSVTTLNNEILHLLQERNRYLIKFSVLNKSELKKFKDGNYNDLDAFYNTRENLLGMVTKIEMLISRKIEELKEDALFTSAEFKNTINEILKMKDNIIKEILDLDLDILSTIDREKSKIFNEMQSIKKSRKGISAYKSGSTPPKLNEEV